MEETVRLMLKEIRKKAGVTQTSLAKELGVDTKTVGNWERGETIPNALQIWACAVALGTDPNSVLGWYEEHPRDALPADDAHRQIVAAFDDLSEEGREVAVNVVSGMARTYPQAGGPPRLVAQDASA